MNPEKKIFIVGKKLVLAVISLFIFVLILFRLIDTDIPPEPTHDERLDGPYFLHAMEGNYNMSLAYGSENGFRISRIGSTVFAVGWNDDYFVVQRHPDGIKAITQYYIIKRGNENNHSVPSGLILGPFNKLEFMKEKENGICRNIQK